MSKKSTQHTEVFSKLTPNTHLLHLSLLRQLNNNRAGTASTKTRAEVRGGGKKPWRQKGTGRARVGSIRSPLWVGGGIAFGPKPRSYESKLPKKARNLAILQAIAAKKDNLVVLNNLPKIKDSKTKGFVDILNSQGLTNKPILFICDTDEPNYNEIKRASSNLQYVLVKNEKFLGVHEILKSNTLVVTEKALSELEKRFLKVKSK